MRLDQTEIAIRERGFLEIMDLALVLLRNYWRRAIVLWAIMAVPLMLVNHLMAHWIIGDLDDAPLVFGYLNVMVLLVAIQAPVVSLLLTTYLGRVVFRSWPTTWELVRTAIRCVVPIIGSVLIVRGVLCSWLFIFLYRRTESFTPLYLLLLITAAFAVAVRATRPYIMEIILLERSSIDDSSRRAIKLSERSRSLHGLKAGDLMGRFIASAAIAAALVASLVGTVWFFSGMLLMDWQWGDGMVHVVFPGALWMVAGFMAVVRFLSYLDLRIRGEGWEAVLLFRAAAEGLPPAPGSGSIGAAGKMVRAGMVACFLLCCFTRSWAATEYPQVPWLDQETGELVSPDLEQYVPPQPPQDWAWKMPSWPQWNWNTPGIGWAVRPLELVAWILVVIAALVLLYFIIRSMQELELGQGRATDRKTLARQIEVERLADLPFDAPEHEGGLLAAVQQKYEAGQYGEAIVLLFGYQLLQLDKHQRIHLLKGKTNRQYLRELTGSASLRDLLKRSMHTFEDFFFGHHAITQAQFERHWNALDEFHANLERPSGAANGA